MRMIKKEQESTYLQAAGSDRVREVLAAVPPFVDVRIQFTVAGSDSYSSMIKIRMPLFDLITASTQTLFCQNKQTNTLLVLSCTWCTY